MRVPVRVLVAAALTLVVSAATLPALSPPTSAATAPTQPALTSTQASFTIPDQPSGTWMLRLWTMPKPTTLVGETTGTTGTLTLPVPQTKTCQFQVDVRFTPQGETESSFYSGLITTVPGCGKSGNGERLTPGYWKNHPDATAALLPQVLGNYYVGTADQATAVFDAMRCSDGVDCLAGHLLAAKLDVANGSSICITGMIREADVFLRDVGYDGPGSYTTTSAQRSTAISFASRLDDYTNDSTSTGC